MDVLTDLAMAYYSVGQLDLAEKSMREVVSRSATGREEAKQFLDLLVLQRSPEDSVKARQLAESVLQARPDQVAARMLLGRVAEQEGDFAQALAMYQDVLKAYPAFAPAMKRAVLLASGVLEDDSIAYTYGMKAREYYPDDSELSLALGQVVYRRGDFKYAIQLLKEAAAAHPDDVNLLYHLGLAEYQSKELSAARKALTRAIELDPNHSLTAQARQALKSM
jgi:Flp pilus assembly protein TadD